MRALGIAYRASLVTYVLGALLFHQFLLAGAPFLAFYLGRWYFRRRRARKGLPPRLPRSERRRRLRRDRAVTALTAQGYKFSRSYSAVARAERDGAYCLFTTAEESLRRNPNRR